MEWNRGVRPNQPATHPAGHSAGAPSAPARRGKMDSLRGMRFAAVLLLFSATILVVALLWYVVLRGGGSESRYVDNKKMQAVFLNGGQVYFGRINALNDRYLQMSDIYYLRVNQQVQPNQQNAQQTQNNDISLVKLGCELHGPQDSMVINREHVIFWENLKDDGQVAKAVAEYRKQNPEGQKCEQASGDQSSSQTQEQAQPAPAAQTPAATTPRR